MKRETGSVKNGEKNVTFADIAAYTGFSKTTISRYFKAIPLRNWGRVLGKLEIMYLNRLTVEETWQITVFIVYCKKIEQLFFKPLHNIVFLSLLLNLQSFLQDLNQNQKDHKVL